MDEKQPTANLTIKEWAEDDRPREKLLSKGARQLSNAELIAILIGSGTRTETAVDVAKRVLAIAKNSLGDLGKKTYADLTALKGIGEAKAVTILAALELGRRRSSEQPEAVDRIVEAYSAAQLFFPLLADIPYEEFWILLLNRANRVLDKQRVGQGGLTSTAVDVKLIAKLAVSSLAVGIIVVHNHPSGNLKPSESDKALTARIKSGLEILDIQLIDHLIIGDNRYYSFAEESLL